jgi:hypothetical protein
MGRHTPGCQTPEPEQTRRSSGKFLRTGESIEVAKCNAAQWLARYNAPGMTKSSSAPCGGVPLATNSATAKSANTDRAGIKTHGGLHGDFRRNTLC